MTSVVMKGEDVKKMANEVREFRKDYQKVQYAFDIEADDYVHLKLM